jgi:NAD(P)H-hydrate epimerase
VLLTAEQAKDVDRRLREEFGISTLVLMENAGRAVADEAAAMCRKGRKIAIFCGKGNNGGDGFVAARHLMTRGIKTDIFLAGTAEDVRNEAKVNLNIIVALGHEIITVTETSLSSVSCRMKGYGLMIDALLGVGLKGDVAGIFKDLIDMINASGTRVLAVDIPSGLDATTGKILGSCVRADTTVTFIAPKQGMEAGDGPKVCGRIIVKDLGVPADII